LLRFQSYAGLSPEKLSSDKFTSVVEITLSDALGVPARTSTNIGLVPMIDTNTLNLIFGVNVTSGLTSNEVISRLKSSINGGDFLNSLSTAIGDTITNTTIAVFVDATLREFDLSALAPLIDKSGWQSRSCAFVSVKTQMSSAAQPCMLTSTSAAQPCMLTSTSYTLHMTLSAPGVSSTTVAAIVAGCFGAALLITIALVVIYCKSGSGRRRRRLSVHAEEDYVNEVNSVDEIPVGVTSTLTRTSSQFI
jgi:hypothetical protein